MAKIMATILFTAGYILGTCVFIHVIWFGGDRFDKTLLTVFLLATVVCSVFELWIRRLEPKK